ncbi:MAG: ATP-binding protein, partial [Actinomycetota bacterium]
HEIQRYETQIWRKDGNLVNVALTLSPIRDEDGRPIGASAIARDMTDETLAQSDREETLSLLKATLESTADGILVVNLDGKIISFNQKFLDLWRIPDEIAESRDDDRAIGFVLEQLKDPESFVEKVKELYEHPKATSFDVLEFKDGRIFERHSQPQEVGGRGVGRVWSFRDVTEREGSKRKLQASLEREQEAAHQLRSLDEIKNAFLAAVSHELRTPLTSVLGTAVTLQERRDAMSREIQDEMFHSLARNARKLERLLSDLLDVDRLVRGVLQPHLETTDVEGLVRNSIEDVDSKDHPIELRVDKVIASIDAPKVQRIVENLVANAVKYTPAGTRIWVTVSPVSGGLLISVEDEGPGVPEEFKQKAFEPFQRGGQNLHAPGTGIGLTLVARFSELHGGKAWIEDRPSGGAVFLVSIPCEIVQSVFESVDGESSAI